MTTRPSYAHIVHHDSFEHERLKLSDQSIRLFQVQRGNKDDPISLRMTQFSANRRPNYKAVSYTWGSAANPKNILVNGRAFALHINLWDLLYHLRLSGETSFLWADALCINQTNLRERNFHVQLMGKIYQAATSVIVWLGVPSLDRIEIRAFDFIKEIIAYRKEHTDTAFFKAYFKPDIRPRWENLLRMTNHPYWHRTWIIQEFLFAPDLEVFSGKHKLDWTDFEDLVSFLGRETRSQTQPVVPRILQSRTTRLTLRRIATSQSSLHDLLREYNDSTCTERRDKVYGILGLAFDCAENPDTGEPVGVKPDYDKHILDVYLDALECIRISLASNHTLPAAALLVLKALHIDIRDLLEFLSITDHKPESQSLVARELRIAPKYVSPVIAVFNWSSIRDLQGQLESYDWGQHVGYQIRKLSSNSLAPGPRARLRRGSSTKTIHASLPEDFMSNAIDTANLCTKLSHLHNYPSGHGLSIPLEHIALHPEDKRLYKNTTSDKPAMILEQSSESEVLRLGFASTNVQRGDRIIQFRGLDTTLVVREVSYAWTLVGKAMMIKNSNIVHDELLDPICNPNAWSSHCWIAHNPEGLELTTTPLALAELLMDT